MFAGMTRAAASECDSWLFLLNKNLGCGSGSPLSLKKAFRNAWQPTFGKALPSAECFPRFWNAGASTCACLADSFLCQGVS
jgi:hypothetical protein